MTEIQTLEEILFFYGMPKENISAAVNQINCTYGANRYLDGLHKGISTTREMDKEVEAQEREIERKVGSTFMFHGDTYKVVPMQESACYGCAFAHVTKDDHVMCLNPGMKCSGAVRSDNTSVVFQRIKIGKTWIDR